MTSFDEIFKRTLHKIEKDADFFSYYNVKSKSEVENLIREQLVSYLPDAIDKIYEYGTPQIDLYGSLDLELQEFTIDLTQREIGLISSLMFLVYIERQITLLNAYKMRLSPSDLNTITPSTERRTFMELWEKIKHECSVTLSHYFSVDRLTNQRLTIDHSVYDYES